MVNLLKISIVISMGVWLMFLSGCEKQPETKERKTSAAIVSGTISQPPSGNAAKKAPSSLPATGAKEITPSTAVTEELAKRELGSDPLHKEVAATEMAMAYDPAGKVDPFIPLLQEKETTNPDIEEKPKRILTPLEQLGISQIKLVAVILMKNRQIAMVEDATGKGYEVKIGTYMGKNGGQVSEINQSSILVKEFLKDYKGKRQAHFQEIKLHKNESGE